MIPSILGKRLDEDIHREERVVRLKRYIIVLLGCAALAGLGVWVYYIYHALSR